MKYKKWGPEIWQQIEPAIKIARDNSSHPIAAFDADGTLWDTDLGEMFFKYQIEHQLLKGLPADPWKHYYDWKESGDPRPAYLWLAQINKGRSLNEIRAWAQDCVKSNGPLPIFDEQKRLFELLLKNNIRILVITASVKWAVEPGARQLGLDFDSVLGVATKVENNVITEQQSGVMTYRAGKTQALLAATHGEKAFLCCGNSIGDLELLESSTGLRLALSAAQKTDKLFLAEEKLRVHAEQNNWLTHRFLFDT